MNRRALMIGGGAVVAGGVAASYFATRSMGSMSDYTEAVAAARSALVQAPEKRDFVRFAVLAPSGHNTQPWLFRPSPRRIEITPDLSRRTVVVDPDDHHLFVGLGCAAENLSIAAGARARPGEIRFDAENGGSLVFEFGRGGVSNVGLFDAIAKRQSTRSIYDGRAVGVEALRALGKAASMPGVDVALITDRAAMKRVSDLVIEGNNAQMRDPAFVRELGRWLRFNPRRALMTGDGLFSAASGSPVLPSWAGPELFDLAFKVGAENNQYARQMASSAGLAVFVSAGEDKEHWTLAGRACQRFLLQATLLGIRTAFVNQPVEVARLRPALADLAGLHGRRPDLLVRFGYGPRLPYSARRPTANVMIA